MNIYELALHKAMGGEGGSDVTVKPLSVTENGSYSEDGVAYSPVEVDVQGSQPFVEAEEKDVNFYDYNGTRLYSYTVNEWANVSELPQNPSHDKLLAEGWNYTKTEIDEEVSILGVCDIGQMYTTQSGKTEIDIVLPDNRLNPYLTFAFSGSVLVDWGDGIVSQFNDGTSLTTTKYKQHNYSKSGAYTITISPFGSESKYAMYCADYAGLISSGSNSTGAISAANSGWASFVHKVRLGNNVVIGKNAFNKSYINELNVPSTASFNGTFIFEGDGIGYIVVPRGVTTLNGSLFNSYKSLQGISLPRTLTKIEGNSVYSTSIRRLVIPSSVTDMSATNAIGSNPGLLSLIIPPNVPKLSGQTNLNGLGVMRMLPTIPPTLSSTFNNFPTDCKIYVPYSADHSILEAYKTTTNWSTYASQMEEDSQ